VVGFLLAFENVEKVSSESSSLSESPRRAFRGVMLVVENLKGQALAPCPGCLHLMQIISSELKVEMVLAFLFRFAMFEIEKWREWDVKI
jgi:hypothetical protein